MAVGFLTLATCKNVPQNLIPRATAYFTAVIFCRGTKISTEFSLDEAEQLLVVHIASQVLRT